MVSCCINHSPENEGKVKSMMHRWIRIDENVVPESGHYYHTCLAGIYRFHFWLPTVPIDERVTKFTSKITSLRE